MTVSLTMALTPSAISARAHAPEQHKTARARMKRKNLINFLNASSNCRRVKCQASEGAVIEPIQERAQSYRRRQRDNDGPFKNEILFAPPSRFTHTRQQVKTPGLFVTP